MTSVSPEIRRVIREIKETNAEFLNLRTVITPDPENDVSKFYFIMFPNDGAASHLPIVGAMYIPAEYPRCPPVIHVYTTTGRYNVDVYRFYSNDKSHSTLCFDILREKSMAGAWEPSYTISTLFASLMSALVSFYVPQEYGPDQAEYVTMEKLSAIKSNVAVAYQKYKCNLPHIPQVPLVTAKIVAAIPMSFPNKMTVDRSATFSFGPLYLQNNSLQNFTVALDLSELHAGIVFSVVLSNSKTDLVGKSRDTVLVRNGVTATAARKSLNDPQTKWFYHGKPMNDGNMLLHVTIGQNQMTFAYDVDGRKVVHGDCAVSRLGELQLGRVSSIPFYLNLFLKRKSGKPISIYTVDTKNTGFIHDVTSGMPDADDFLILDLFDKAEEEKTDSSTAAAQSAATQCENGLSTNTPAATDVASNESSQSASVASTKSWRQRLFGT